MSFAYYSDVERAYNDLKAEGKIMPRSTPEAVEADKGLLTQRSGWYVYQKNPTIGVLEKTSGNNYLGYSVDLLIQTNGTFWDIATDNGIEALPVNGGPSSDPSLVPSWRPPSAELAQMPDQPAPGPDPEPIPDDSLQQILDAITASEGRINQHTTDEADRVINRLNELRQEVIDFADIAGKVLILLGIAKRRPVSALYLDDDEDLVVQLRRTADWLENEGAHRPAREEYHASLKQAAACRAAAVRLEQFVTAVDQANERIVAMLKRIDTMEQLLRR